MFIKKECYDKMRSGMGVDKFTMAMKKIKKSLCVSLTVVSKQQRNWDFT